MYRPSVLGNSHKDPQEAYLTKLRKTILELHQRKELAIRDENYALADETKQKMQDLKVQVVKMEHQLNADVLVSCLTQWLVDLADAVSNILAGISPVTASPGRSYTSLSINGRAVPIPVDFPLAEPFHTRIIDLIEETPMEYHDSLLRAIAVALPQDLPDLPKSPYGWDSYARRIVGLPKTGDVVDLVKSAFTLGLADMAMKMTQNLQPKVIRRESIDLILRHAFFYVRTTPSLRRISAVAVASGPPPSNSTPPPSLNPLASSASSPPSSPTLSKLKLQSTGPPPVPSTRSTVAELDVRFFEAIMLRWSIVVGDVALHDRTDIIANINAVILPESAMLLAAAYGQGVPPVSGTGTVNRRTGAALAPTSPAALPPASHEEIIATLSVTRYVSGKIARETQARQMTELIRDYCGLFDRVKKTAVRVAIIVALERLVQPLDYSAPSQIEPWETPLINEIVELHKRAKKWAQSEDLRGAALRLVAIILVNSKIDYFGKNIETYLREDLCGKTKIKPYIYDCLLQLLRGRYYLDTLLHARQRVNGTFNISEAYAFVTRPLGEEASDEVVKRLREIADLLFVRRKGPIGEENLDTCAEIVVQMAVHNLDITLRLMQHLFHAATNANAEGNTEVLYVVLRALRTVVDASESGFAGTAERAAYLAEQAFEFAPRIVQILALCEHHVGMNVFGRAGRVVEPPSWWEGKVKNALAAAEAAKPGGLGVSSGGNEEGVYTGRQPGDDIVSMLGDGVERMRFEDGDEQLNSLLGIRRGSVGTVRTDAGSLVGSVAEAPAAAAGAGAVKGTDGESIYAMNSKVVSAVTEWYKGVGVNLQGDVASKLVETTSLVDPAQSNRFKKGDALKGEQAMLVKLLKEALRIVPCMPVPALVAGELFVGMYVVHCNESVAYEAGLAIQKIFFRYPDTRISVVNGFLNYIKTTPFQDDITMTTVLTHMSTLLRVWTQVEKPLRHLDNTAALNAVAMTGLPIPPQIDRNALYKVSCKLDGCMLVMLARPNAVLRHRVLEILKDFNGLLEEQGILEALDAPTLRTIMLVQGRHVSRHGLYGFMEKDLHGYALGPKVTAGLTLLTIEEVAKSEVNSLNRYFVGELARLFARDARGKARRHAAKFLVRLALPLMTSVANIDASFVMTYGSFSALLFALAGVPLKSEIPFAYGSVTEAEGLLFGQFKSFLTPILNSDNAWEIKAVVHAAYFVHPCVVQLLLVHLLQWFNEMRRGPATRALNPRMPDNVMYLLRCMSSAPQWELLVREPSVFGSNATLTDIVTEFLHFTQNQLFSDPGTTLQSFISGPVYRLKSAIHFCVLVERLAEGVAPLHGQWDVMRGQVPDDSAMQNGVNGEAMPRLPPGYWNTRSRRAILQSLKDWYNAAQDAIVTVQASGAGGDPTFSNVNYALGTSFNPLISATNGSMSGTSSTADRGKILYSLHRLVGKIGQAAEKLFSVGDPFDIPEGMNGDGGVGPSAGVAPDILTWMARLQSNGYSVIIPTLLYQYETVLGTVLAHSYTGRSEFPMVFSDAVFDQVLPRVWLGPQMFLDGVEGPDGAGINETAAYASSEEYIASIHGLPEKADGTKSGLLLPNLDGESASKMRQHMGSLIFFGLYNMMNVSKMVRNRAFLFVRELFILFNPDPSVDVESFFAKYSGSFYSNVGHRLRPKILEMSKLASTLFADDASTFLWEAVRCSRSVQKAEKPSTLLPSQQWVLTLILPWCQYVNFSNVQEDPVFGEFYRYLMDAAFYRPSQPTMPSKLGLHDDTFDALQQCWTEIIGNREYGLANALLVTETLIHVCGKVDRLREQSLALLSATFAVYPDMVADALAFQLSSQAFPWKPRAPATGDMAVMGPDGQPVTFGPFQKHTTPIVREYLAALRAMYGDSTAIGGFNNLDFIGGNLQESMGEYGTLCKASVMMLSELLLQNYTVVADRHLPVLLNYVILNLPDQLHENSVSTFLLANMVEGFIAQLHASKAPGGDGPGGITAWMAGAKGGERARVMDLVRRALVLLDSTVCVVSWETDELTTGNPPPTAPEESARRIAISDLLNLLLGIFSTFYENLRIDLAAEVLGWAAEGLLGPKPTIRAIETFTILIRSDPPLPPEMLNALSSRLFDHVTILATMEMEAVARSNTTSAAMNAGVGPGMQSVILGWSEVLENKSQLKRNTESVLTAILRLHGTLIDLHAKAGELIEHPKLFWGSVCMLNIPALVFPRIYLLALDNCRNFLNHQRRVQNISQEDFVEAYDAICDKIRDAFQGIQQQVLQVLFPPQKLAAVVAEYNVPASAGNQLAASNALLTSMQEKAFDLLLKTWTMLPDVIADATEPPLALLYTLLYSLTYLFALIESNSFEKAESFAANLRQAIEAKRPYEFQVVIKCLQTIESRDPSARGAGAWDLLGNCVANVARVFLPEYVNNIAEYLTFAMKFDSIYSRIILRMFAVFWDLAVREHMSSAPPMPPTTPSMAAAVPPMFIGSMYGPAPPMPGQPPNSPPMSMPSAAIASALAGTNSATMGAPLPPSLMASFKSFVRKLPYLKENLDEGTRLISAVLEIGADKDGTFVEVDLTANANAKIEAFEEVIYPVGTAKLTQLCLSHLGVQPSAVMYAY
ncbi:hypothetical protein BJ742DRAFT_542930 [Cladochytrium replicatum]|nr:hypothetical protein BJ742DRAFT_542930 [Cladochytrium replicatum]